MPEKSLSDLIICVTGANRGIGLEFVLQLAAAGSTVVGGYRTKASSHNLLELGRSLTNVHPVELDVLRSSDLQNLYDRIERDFGHVDILINNAGQNIKEDHQLSDLELSDLTENFNVNVGGPFLTAQSLYPLLLLGSRKLIVNITSNMGSIANNGGGSTPYRLSKAALNMLTGNQAIEYGRDGVTVIGIHPGWVVTDMGGTSASLTTAQSVKAMLKVVAGVTKRESGKFLSYTGAELPF